MNEFEIGYDSYFKGVIYDDSMSNEWKVGYTKAIEDQLNEIFGELYESAQ